ncbi:MAG: family 5 extracellular solute-binding protein peptide/nickel transport system substrate-binding [Candidatus Nomurabacteria bacterium]|nr:family 5 extracellular solute-binding protein peptide/nickel transport system substrate-binding [Candidatus Nomurabacteria bacterium]
MDNTHNNSRAHYKWRAHIKALYSSLSPERVLMFWGLLSLSLILLFSALVVVNNRFLISKPGYGGEVREGIIGTPRFINPIFSTTDQDKDLTSLVFAGLTKKDAAGNIILDMAQSINKSDDGLSYDVLIKDKATFHDGVAVTADDIIYTVGLIQNPALKSPLSIKWEGITIEKKGDKEVVFNLKKPYPLFMDVLSVGILPKHIWKNLTDEQISLSDYNIHAIGSGPYKIKSVTSISGIPDTFTLIAHEGYTLGRPYIDTITIATFQSEKYLLQAFQNRKIDRIHNIAVDKIDSLNINPSNIHTSLLPRTFSVFFNPNKTTILSDKNVRAALQMAIDKQALVDKVLHKYGKVINGPFPFDDNQIESVYDVEQAKSLLEKSAPSSNGSTTLSITLTTANTDEMKSVAEMIKADWAKIGVDTNIQVYEVADLNQSIIKERNFEVLLFGFITEDPGDLYAFWHSSQRNYPGLNISNYVSKNLDANLEIVRSSDDASARQIAYEEIKKEFAEEVPGIFLFAPSLTYITNDNIRGQIPIYSLDSSARFLLAESWYKYTDRIWPKTYYKDVIEKIENIIH